MSIYFCGAVIIKDCIFHQGCHDTELEARDCSLLNLSLRDRKKLKAEEAAILLHPELNECPNQANQGVM